MTAPELKSAPGTLATAATLGTQLAVGMAAFAGLGYYIDRRRGGGYGFTLAGIFLGLFYIGYEIWKLVRQVQEGDTQRAGTTTSDGKS